MLPVPGEKNDRLPISILAFDLPPRPPSSMLTSLFQVNLPRWKKRPFPFLTEKSRRAINIEFRGRGGLHLAGLLVDSVVYFSWDGKHVAVNLAAVVNVIQV